jgi:hypothetical protein
VSNAKILHLPAVDTLWHEACGTTEAVHDLLHSDIPCPEIIEGVAYEWARQTHTDVREAMRLLREALKILEVVRNREGERFQTHNARLESLGIEP